METKLCNTCKKQKPRCEFYAHKKTSDGLLGRCKDCHKEAIRRVRQENIERYREFDKKRSNNPDRVAARAAYQKSDAGKASHAKASRKYWDKNPEKRIAHIAVGSAIASGRLIRPNECSCCGKIGAVEAHHDDYALKLDVRWLCTTCHAEFHKNNDK